MKVKLFTHTDLDGVSCAIIGKLAFDDNIDIVYCDYHNINDYVAEFIDSNNVDEYTHIFITDISVEDVIAEKLNILNDKTKVALIDHHPTALWLDRTYDWAIVKPLYKDGTKTAGTTLFLDYIKQHYPELLDDVKAEEYAETVRRYDTWDWVKLDDNIPKKYNDLLRIIGRDRFIKKIIPEIKIFGTGIYLNEEDLKILEIYQEQIDRYINSAEKKMTQRKIDGHNVGVVFAEQFISELGNELAKRNPDLDYVLMINMLQKTYSLRSVKGNIHLGQISKKLFGGGGHPKAAGAQLTDEQVNYIIDYLLP